MQRKFSGFVLFVIVLLSVFSWSCTKVDTTTLGADLIPAVDNVSTFDTVININATQGFFNDETKLGRTENHLVGNITNDPVFGKTNAEIFVELKPGFFPYYFGAAGDTINPIVNPATEGFDSVILCLSVKGFYGDTNIAQHLKVYALDQSTSNFKDSAYMLNFLPTPSYLGSTEIGNAIVSPKPTDLAKYNYFNITNTKKDSSTNQIRIKLDGNYMGQTFLKALTANTDTTNASFPYYSDNNFKNLFKGFAITGDNTANGNGLFYINLAEANTRLEVYYHSRKKDTSYSAFTLNSSASLTITSSAHATHLERDRVTGSPEIATPQPDAVYIQSTPGTYASLKIPELSDFSKLNRIIHRAEIILEQVPGNPAIDKALAGPTYLYLDLKDTGTVEKYKTIYKDLNPSTIYTPDATTLYYPSGGIDFSYFGGFIRDSYDPAFNRVYYNFNVSRYIQDMVTNHIPNYEIRVYAPYNLTYNGTTFPFPNSALFLANGRVKIGNGNNPNYKLRMRIVYSKI